ncbi:MAG: VanZ family protein [Clostridia bacterium]|nr:VanZ family protein [Clostridia bacterium]
MKKLFRHWMLFLLIAHCVLIFGFSAQNAGNSANSSRRISNKIVERVDKTKMNKVEQVRLPQKVEYITRKCAHALLYLVLGILTFGAAKKYLKRRHFLWAAIFCLLYAASDELHQYFVPGRSGQISDVAIDFVSSLFGISISYLIIKIKRRKKA